MNCPLCHSVRVRKSKTGNERLGFLLSLVLVGLRCCDCGKMFFRLRLLAANLVHEAPTKKKRAA